MWRKHLAELSEKYELPEELCRQLDHLFCEAAGAAAPTMAIESFWQTVAETAPRLELQPEASTDTVLESETVAELLQASDIHANMGPARASASGQPAGEPIGKLGRYRDHGLIGRGGIGEVRRVHDPRLNRMMAMKIIQPKALGSSSALARFLEEAQVTAQLQHPGIVPVHEVGCLPDGRFYYTMKEVRGHPYSEVIGEVHRASSQDEWVPSPSGWTFRRLVDVFSRVCEAMAYAHAVGVIHRDLKPENVMIGSYGEVLVVDWGLAKVLERADIPPDVAEQRVVTERSVSGAYATRTGVVAGTPAYMPPEQARGELDRLDERSDVYSLGAILYEVLSGRPPFEGPTALAVLAQVVQGMHTPPGRIVDAMAPTLSLDFDLEFAAPSGSGPPLPKELVDSCLRAMSLVPSERQANAGELASEVSACLERARHRERALAVVRQAVAKQPEAEALRKRAADLHAVAEEELAGVEPWEDEEKKASGWDKQDVAAELERQAQRKRREAKFLLHGALTHAPDAMEAHDALVRIYQLEHAEAERGGDIEAMERTEALLRKYATSLRADSRLQRLVFHYLKGVGAVTLVTAPADAEVLAYRYQRVERRLLPVFERSLGRTPLVAEPLDMGSWLLLIRGEECVEVRCPICLRRGEHWTSLPPGEAEPRIIRLPSQGELGADEVYVPAGWFLCGGDDEAYGSMPAHRVWVEGFVMKRFPVTRSEYAAFLNDLLSRGREDEALRWAPRGRPGTAEEQGSLVYARDELGRFLIPQEVEEEVREHGERPVTRVDWSCAKAYASWLGETRGPSWRLPFEMEWEKAARGCDGRVFPWGDFLDPSWCCMRDSHEGRPRSCKVNSFPVDESAYGVRGMAGNVLDWCEDVYRPEGPPVVEERWSATEPSGDDSSYRVYRGGLWGGVARYARCASRYANAPSVRDRDLGFRLARSFT